MTFAGISNGRFVSLAFPCSVILKGRCLLNGSNFGRVFSVIFAKVKRPCTIGASGDAVSATDAGFIVNDDDAVRSLPCRLDRTDRSARWVIALHARSRQKLSGHIRIFANFFV